MCIHHNRPPWLLPLTSVIMMWASCELDKKPSGEKWGEIGVGLGRVGKGWVNKRHTSLAAASWQSYINSADIESAQPIHRDQQSTWNIVFDKSVWPARTETWQLARTRPRMWWRLVAWRSAWWGVMWTGITLDWPTPQILQQIDVYNL